LIKYECKGTKDSATKQEDVTAAEAQQAVFQTGKSAKKSEL
jgi:hypothetical protein